jgi:chromate reductase
MTILGIAGSLRKQSFNRSLLRAAQKLAPTNVEVKIFELEGIPLYNQDTETSPPVRVTEFKAAIRAADGVLLVTPEYNYSVPGVLKNAIDWASRPYGDNAWDGKPVAIMGASIGNFGSARAQYHLRQMLVFLNMFPLNQPELMVGQAQNVFDQNGELTDEKTRKRVADQVTALAAWIRRLQK